MKRYIKIGTIGFLILWAIFSFIDYNFARTTYGGMYLTKYNFLVVAYNTLDNLLKGFMF